MSDFDFFKVLRSVSNAALQFARHVHGPGRTEEDIRNLYKDFMELEQKVEYLSRKHTPQQSPAGSMPLNKSSTHTSSDEDDGSSGDK